MNLPNLIFYAVGIPLIIYVVVRRLEGKYKFSGNTPLLIAACVLFSISVFIPSPQIHGDDTEFLTHLLGGGVFTGMIWLYFKPIMKTRPWYVELLQLFVLVSALGVVNELYELFAFETGITLGPINDTSWDLLANTLGAGLFYGGYQASEYLKSLLKQR